MRLISVAKAAEEIDLSAATIHNMVREGRLTKYQLKGGKTLRVDMDQLYGLFMPEGVEFDPANIRPPKKEVRRPQKITAWERRRRETLHYLREYINTHGETPSLFAIADRFGLGVAAVQARMKDLENRGLIRIDSPMSIKHFECTVLEGGTE